MKLLYNIILLKRNVDNAANTDNMVFIMETLSDIISDILILINNLTKHDMSLVWMTFVPLCQESL